MEHPYIYTAHVVCRQAGYQYAVNAMVTSNSVLSERDTSLQQADYAGRSGSVVTDLKKITPIHMYLGGADGTGCDGTESSLTDCKHQMPLNRTHTWGSVCSGAKHDRMAPPW